MLFIEVDIGLAADTAHTGTALAQSHLCVVPGLRAEVVCAAIVEFTEVVVRKSPFAVVETKRTCLFVVWIEPSVSFSLIVDTQYKFFISKYVPFMQDYWDSITTIRVYMKLHMNYE